METGNLFENIPGKIPEELFETIIKNKNLTVKRIVSKGHCSPKEGWYDQQKDEWVLLVKGEAKLRFEENNQCVHLTLGTHINIPAHKKHKVEWTDPDRETIWLAIYY